MTKSICCSRRDERYAPPHPPRRARALPVAGCVAPGDDTATTGSTTPTATATPAEQSTAPVTETPQDTPTPTVTPAPDDPILLIIDNDTDSEQTVTLTITRDEATVLDETETLVAGESVEYDPTIGRRNIQDYCRGRWRSQPDYRSELGRFAVSGGSVTRRYDRRRDQNILGRVVTAPSRLRPTAAARDGACDASTGTPTPTAARRLVRSPMVNAPTRVMVVTPVGVAESTTTRATVWCWNPTASTRRTRTRREQELQRRRYRPTGIADTSRSASWMPRMSNITGIDASPTRPRLHHVAPSAVAPTHRVPALRRRRR